MSVDAFKIQKSLVINPRGAQPTSPEPGEQIYNSVTNTMQYYNGLIWIDVVNSSGVGSVAQNLITDGDAQSGVTNYIEGSYTAATRPTGTFTAASGAGLFTISTTTVTPINGTTSFLLTKSAGASRQGRAVERTIVLDREYQTKVLQMRVKFNVVSGIFVAGAATTDSSAIFYIGQFNGTTWTYTEPSTFKTLSASSIVDYVSGSFQVNADTTQIKLISYVAEAVSSAWVLECEFEITPSTYAYGTPITNWQSFSANITSTGTAPSLGTPTTNKARWRQVGSQMEIEWDYRFGSGQTNGTGMYLFNMPAGFSIDTVAKPANTSTTISNTFADSRVGDFVANDNYEGVGGVFVYSATQLKVGYVYEAGTVPWNSTGGLTSYVTLRVSVPILGWSSSTQISDGFDGRELTLRMTKTDTAQLLANNTITKVTFNNTVLTKGLSWDATNNRVVCVSAGTYAGEASLQFGNSGVITGIVRIYKNGILTHEGRANAPSGTNPQPLVAFRVDLIAGDYLEVFGLQLSGAGLNILNEPSGTFFAISKLSGSQTISASELTKSTITQTSGQGIPTSVNTKLQGIVVRDTHGMWSTVTNEWTQPRAGTGSISGCFHISIDNTTTGITTELYKDGVSVNSRYLIATGIAYSYPLEYFWATNGVAGTKWSLYVFQGTGFTRPVLSASASNQITFKLD